MGILSQNLGVEAKNLGHLRATSLLLAFFLEKNSTHPFLVFYYRRPVLEDVVLFVVFLLMSRSPSPEFQYRYRTHL